VDFEYIRKCLIKKVKPEVKLLNREIVFNETDQSQFALNRISYNFNKPDHETLDHESIKFGTDSFDKMKG
jgi:hypothetical protein